jgi:hypothetical protein
MRFTVFRSAVLAALALAAFFAYPRVADYIAMDKCLDGRGIYAYGICRSSAEGVFDPPDPKPVLLGSSVSALAVLILGPGFL